MMDKIQDDDDGGVEWLRPYTGTLIPSEPSMGEMMMQIAALVPFSLTHGDIFWLAEWVEDSELGETEWRDAGYYDTPEAAVRAAWLAVVCGGDNA